MAEPEIKVRLVLVPEGESLGEGRSGTSPSEERAFKLEDLRAARILSKAFPSLLGRTGRLMNTLLKFLPAVAVRAIMLGTPVAIAAFIPGDETRTQKQIQEAEARRNMTDEQLRHKRALFEMEEAGIEWTEGVQYMEDGSIRVVDKFGVVVAEYGKDTVIINTFGQFIQVVFGNLAKDAKDTASQIVSAIKEINKRLNAVKKRESNVTTRENNATTREDKLSGTS